jgi:hypothetical protein
MNDSQIYKLVHQQPRIRATEIAAALNAELLVVSNALRSLVDVGDLVKSKEFDDDTGRSAQVYELSEEFKRSRYFKDMLGTMNQVQTPAAPAPAPAAAEPADAVEDVAQASPAGEKREVIEQPGVSKVQRGVNFIERFGAASATELREAMGLPEGASVASYLAPAIKNGRVHCDGKLWKSGTGQVPVPPAVVREKLGLDPVEDKGNVVSVGNLVVATRDQSPVPAVTVAKLADAKPSAPTAAPSPTFTGTLTPAKPAERAYRCAIWSDGKVEIHKNGYSITVTQAELAEIMAFAADRRAA